MTFVDWLLLVLPCLLGFDVVGPRRGEGGGSGAAARGGGGRARLPICLLALLLVSARSLQQTLATAPACPLLFAAASRHGERTNPRWLAQEGLFETRSLNGNVKYQLVMSKCEMSTSDVVHAILLRLPRLESVCYGPWFSASNVTKTLPGTAAGMLLDMVPDTAGLPGSGRDLNLGLVISSPEQSCWLDRFNATSSPRSHSDESSTSFRWTKS